MGFFSKPKETMETLKQLGTDEGLIGQVGKFFSDREKRRKEKEAAAEQDAEKTLHGIFGGGDDDKKDDR